MNKPTTLPTADPTDGLPLMPVGDWSLTKHRLIEQFVGASWAARQKWPYRSYIDLFCGPGRVVVKNSVEVHDGSPLVAWRKASSLGGSFTQIVIGDLDRGNVDACHARLQSLGAPVVSMHGSAESNAEHVLSIVRRDGLHLAVIDPFSLGGLKFEILSALSRYPNIDLIVHFSVMDLQRNIELEYPQRTGGQCEAAAPGWRLHVHVDEVGKESARDAYFEYWKNLIKGLGMKVAMRSPLLKNSNNGPLYRLALLYRNDLALKLWNDVVNLDKQQGLGFD